LDPTPNYGVDVVDDFVPESVDAGLDVASGVDVLAAGSDAAGFVSEEVADSAGFASEELLAALGA